jgi:hypothetical protein
MLPWDLRLQSQVEMWAMSALTRADGDLDSQAFKIGFNPED